MAGLLGNGWGDPQSNAIMQLAGGLLAGNFGQGAAAYGNTMAGAKDAAMKRQFMQSQMDENASQNEARKAAALKTERQMEMDARFMGFGGTAPSQSSPGLPSLSEGGSPTAQPGAQPGEFTAQAIAQKYGIPLEAVISDYRLNGGKKLAEIINDRTKPNWQNIGGNLVNTNGQGFSGGFQPSVSISTNGQASMVQPDGKGGVVVGAPPGALDTYRAYQGAGASFKPIKVYNPATGREEFTSEGAVLDGQQPQGRTGNPMFDAVIATESGGNPNAVSPKGARGLMQVMPGTNSAPGFGVAPARDGSEAERTRVGQDYFGKMQERYKDPALAAIAYNWGPGNTDMWLKSGGDFKKLPAETQSYVAQVLTRNGVNGRAPQSGNYAAGPSAAEKAQQDARATLSQGVARTASENLNTSLAGAQSAMATLQNVEQIRSGLGSAILGPGANVRVTMGQIGQVLGVGGADSAEQLVNTRNVIQGLARQELSAAGQMKGQGQITESERSILRKAEAGNINEFSKPELVTLMGALERSANYRVDQHRQSVEKLRNGADPTSFLDVNQPAPKAAPASSGKTIVQTGMYGGKKVVKYSDGSTGYAN